MDDGKITAIVNADCLPAASEYGPDLDTGQAPSADPAVGQIDRLFPSHLTSEPRIVRVPSSPEPASSAKSKSSICLWERIKDSSQAWNIQILPLAVRVICVE